jgi:hypothetical protein
VPLDSVRVGSWCFASTLFRRSRYGGSPDVLWCAKPVEHALADLRPKLGSKASEHEATSPSPPRRASSEVVTPAHSRGLERH